MPRSLLALPLALLFLASAAQAESAASHVAAAKKAARLHRWPQALKEWQAAYRITPDSDDLIGMGDAYAGLGDKDNARKQYNAYLADPLALDSDSAKSKLAALDKPSNDLDLGLDTPAPAKATAKNDLDLDLSGPSKPAPKKGGKTVASNSDLDLDLSGPSKPAAKPQAKNDLDLDLSPAKPAPKKNDLDDLDSLGAPPPPAKPAAVAVAPPPPAKVAPADSMSLDSLNTPPPPAKVAVAPPPPAVVAPPPAKVAPPPPAKPTADAVTAPPPATHQPAPPPAVQHQATPPPNTVVATREPVVVEHNNRVIAYCTGALAIGALAVGGLYYTKASQNQTDLTSQVRSGSQQQALIEQQKTNKSLALAGIVTGVILAGVTTAIFVF